MVGKHGVSKKAKSVLIETIGIVYIFSLEIVKFQSFSRKQSTSRQSQDAIVFEDVQRRYILNH